MSDSSSLLERSPRLAAAFDFLLLRRQKKSRAKKAANARAPSVHPSTIGSVLEPLPPFPLSGVVVDDAAAALAAEDCVAAEVVGIDAAEALEADVSEEVEESDVEELVVVEDELLEVVEEDAEVVDAGGAPRAEVTTVYIDWASERRELRLICATEDVTNTEDNTTLCIFMLKVR